MTTTSSPRGTEQRCRTDLSEALTSTGCGFDIGENDVITVFKNEGPYGVQIS